MIGIITGMRAEARLVEGLTPLIASTGGHRHSTEQAVAALVKRGATRLVSFGIAGGLDPRLRTGDVVVSTLVRTVLGAALRSSETAPPLPLNPRVHITVGPVLGADRPLRSLADKQHAFRDSGALAVDMESDIVARSGLPFLVIRAIADDAGMALPSAVLAGLDETGRARAWPVLAALACRPSESMAVLRAALASRAALISLFRCRALLGADPV
ncbi:MAG TPA: nucleoside phosphorylase [Dongiaceae bacterium]|jgi:hypothetical protein|nr:nucleoside phosphorylase [Dongiaceae bacterium]